MNTKKINEFIDTSKDVIYSSTNYKVIKHKIIEKNATYICSDVAIVFGISGNIKGQVIFTMSESAAIKIAARIFEEIEIVEFDEIARCSISEFGNILLARAIQVFSDKESYIDISPPALATGTNLVMHIDKMSVIGISITLDDSIPFDINISICEKNS
ncbi:MAG: chemotaxis protein CheX [Clostridiales bacterium]